MVAHAPDGRWGGKLTSRPLPEHDPEIDALGDAQRAELVDVWLGRAANERRVADAFAVIHAALVDRGADGALVALARRAVDDEHRHAELSRVVATRIAGRDLEPPARLALVVPRHPGAPPRLLATLHVLGHCAMNETFASAFLETALARAEVPLARAALRELLSDEIDHARLGWAHLASLSAIERAEVEPWLPALVQGNLEMWRTTPRPYPSDPAVHRCGAPPADAVESALVGAVRNIILPGLDHFGLRTQSLSEWLAAGAPIAQGAMMRNDCPTADPR